MNTSTIADTAIHPADRQCALWAELAPGIGYSPEFVRPSPQAMKDDLFFDHARTVRHRATGQLAILAEPYAWNDWACAQGRADKIAADMGMCIDHFGPGLWWPGGTVAIVMRVVDAQRAAPHFGRAYRHGWSTDDQRPTFMVAQPERFMPRTTRRLSAVPMR